MTSEEKKFAIDLLKALDVAMDGKERNPEEYKCDLNNPIRKDILKTVRYLIKKGYKLNENQKE